LSREFPEPTSPEIFPAIDLRGGRCVRLVKGERGAEIRYDDDPVEVARRWESEGARRLHVVDLGAALGEPDSVRSILEIVRAVTIPVQVGGGIRDEDKVRGILDGGAGRVILGTRAFGDAEFLARCVDVHGPGRIMVSMDFEGDALKVGGWEKKSSLNRAGAILWAERAGVRRFLVTATDRDGTFGGTRIELVRGILADSQAWVVAAGGIGSLEHVREVLSIGHPRLEGVVVGRALYEGKVDLQEAIRCADEIAEKKKNAPGGRSIKSRR